MSSCPKMADPLKRYIIFYFVSPLYHNTSYLETGFIFRSILFAPWKGWFVKLVFIMFLISFIPEFISFLLDLHFMDKVYVQIKSCTSGNNLQMLLKTSECKMLFYVIYYGPLPSTFRICDIFFLHIKALIYRLKLLLAVCHFIGDEISRFVDVKNVQTL